MDPSGPLQQRVLNGLANDWLFYGSAVAFAAASVWIPGAYFLLVGGLCILVFRWGAYRRRARLRFTAGLGTTIYRAKLQRALQAQSKAWAAASETVVAEDQARERARDAPPPAFVDIDRELREISDRIRAERRTTASLEDRTRTTMMDRQRWEELRLEVEAAAVTEPEQRNAAALQRERAGRDNAYRQLADCGERSLNQIIRDLERLRPPCQLADLHARIQAACREALDAGHDYNEANRRSDLQAAIEAAHQTALAWADMADARDQLMRAA
jgi:hypothetical protein